MEVGTNLLRYKQEFNTIKSMPGSGLMRDEIHDFCNRVTQPRLNALFILRQILRQKYVPNGLFTEPQIIAMNQHISGETEQTIYKLVDSILELEIAAHYAQEERQRLVNLRKNKKIAFGLQIDKKVLAALFSNLNERYGLFKKPEMANSLAEILTNLNLNNLINRDYQIELNCETKIFAGIIMFLEEHAKTTIHRNLFTLFPFITTEGGTPLTGDNLKTTISNYRIMVSENNGKDEIKDAITEFFK